MFALLVSVCIAAESDYRYVKTTHPADFKVVSFTLNSISKNKEIIVPQIKDGIIRFNLKDYGISPKVYNSLGKGQLVASYFVTKALTSHYYKFLGISTQQDFRKLVKAQNKEFQQAGIVTQSKVTRFKQMLYREPTILGALWTQQLNKSHDLIIEEYEERSFIAHLPNGLLVYCAQDEKGKLISKLDANLSITYDGKPIRVGISCISCHKKGIEPFTDEIRLLNSKDVIIQTREKTNVFQGNLPFTKDQEIYSNALKLVNGLTPEKNAELVTELFDKYEQPLSLLDATTEIGVNKTKFLKKLSNINNPYLLKWLIDSEYKLPRYHWEQNKHLLTWE